MNTLLAEKHRLDTRELSLLDTEVSRRKKSSTATWLLWLFTGAIGGHRYYIGSIRQAVLQSFIYIVMLVLGLSIASSAETATETLVYAPMTVFLFLSVPTGIALLDAFFINKALRKKNEEIELQVIREIYGMRKKSRPS